MLSAHSFHSNERNLLTAEVETVDKNILTTRTELDAAKLASREAHEKYNTANEAAEATEKENKSAQEASTSLKNIYEAQQTAFSASEDEVKRLEKEVLKSDGEVPGKQSALSRAEGKLEDAKTKLEEAKGKKEEAKKDADSARNKEQEAIETKKLVIEEIANIRPHKDGARPFRDYNYTEYEEQAVGEAKARWKAAEDQRPWWPQTTPPELQKEISKKQGDYDRRLDRLMKQRPKVKAPGIP